MSVPSIATTAVVEPRRQKESSVWLGMTRHVRLVCGALHFLTALTFVQVIRRLFVRGISVEDTMTWWGAWSVVLDGRGRSVYQPAAQMAAQRRWIWVANPSDVAAWAFPPPHTFLFSPLAVMSPWALYATLTVVSAVVWILTVRSMARWARGRGDAWSVDAVALFAAAALAFSPAMGAIRYGSFSILVVAALWQVLRLVESPDRSWRRTVRAALWLAIAALKPQMVILTGLGLLRRRVKTAVVAAALLSMVTVLICSVVGWGLLNDWFAINRSITQKSAGAAVDRMWTFRGVLTRAFGPGPNATIVWQLVFVATLGCLAVLWHRAASADRFLTAFAASLALQCFGFPYQSSYDAVLLVPAVLLAVEVGRRVAPLLAQILSVLSVFAASFVLSGAWNERLPGLAWRVPLPAMFVWATCVLIVAIAARASAQSSTGSQGQRT